MTDGPTESGKLVLRRSTTDKVIAGVCGGLGRRYGIDPIVIRIIWVISILFLGFGLLAYLVFWLVIPLERPGDVVEPG